MFGTVLQHIPELSVLKARVIFSITMKRCQPVEVTAGLFVWMICITIIQKKSNN
jgi:hypothetical protein